MYDIIVPSIVGILYAALGLYVVDGCRHIKSRSIKWVIFLFHPVYMFFITAIKMWEYFRKIMIDR